MSKIHDQTPIAPRRGGFFLWSLLGACLCALVTCCFVFDRDVAQWIRQVQTPAGKEIATQISRWGDFPPLILLTCAALAICVKARRYLWTRILVLTILSSLLAGVVVNPTRALTGRVRPSVKDESGWLGPRKAGKWTAGKHKYSSFPSAHTTVAAAMATPLVIFGGWAGLAAGMVAAAIGASRIYLNAHYISDVAVGAFLGFACAAFICRSVRINRLVSERLARWGWGEQSAAAGAETGKKTGDFPESSPVDH